MFSFFTPDRGSLHPNETRNMIGRRNLCRALWLVGIPYFMQMSLWRHGARVFVLKHILTEGEFIISFIVCLLVSYPSKMNIFMVMQHLNDQRSVVMYLREKHLLKDSQWCVECSEWCTQVTDNSKSDIYMWRCRSCRKKHSIREESFFFRSHIQLKSLFMLIYFWVYDIQQLTIETFLQGTVSLKALGDWMNFCRDICTAEMLRHPVYQSHQEHWSIQTKRRHTTSCPERAITMSRWTTVWNSWGKTASTQTESRDFGGMRRTDLSICVEWTKPNCHCI